jgi:hypothetical protein
MTKLKPCVLLAKPQSGGSAMLNVCESLLVGAPYRIPGIATYLRRIPTSACVRRRRAPLNWRLRTE